MDSRISTDERACGQYSVVALISAHSEECGLPLALGYGQFEYRDFRSRTYPDGQNGSSDAAIDVQLAAGFFVPSADVGRLHSGETEAAMEELKRQLTSVSVPNQCQVNANLCGTIETVGFLIVKQQNVDRIWHHQVLDRF